MEDKKFLIENENHDMVEATELLRIKIDDSDIEYLIYGIEDLEDDDEVLLIPARVKKDENGVEYFERIIDSYEKEMVKKLFEEIVDEKEKKL